MIVAGFLIVNGPSQGGVRGVLVRAEYSDRYRNYALTLQRSNSSHGCPRRWFPGSGHPMPNSLCHFPLLDGIYKPF